GGVGATVLVDVLPGLQAGACAANLPVAHHGGAVDDFLAAVPVRLGRRRVGGMRRWWPRFRIRGVERFSLSLVHQHVTAVHPGDGSQHVTQTAHDDVTLFQLSLLVVPEVGQTDAGDKCPELLVGHVLVSGGHHALHWSALWRAWPSWTTA